MVFEVDNTTEQLINQLQESIQSTIYVLEKGQSEIKELIDEVRESSISLATAAQTDLISEDISKARAAIQKLATADQCRKLDMSQEKILEIVVQEAQDAAEIKSIFSKLNRDIERQADTIMDNQNNSARRLESMISEIAASVADAKIAQLQAIAANLDTLSKRIDLQMDKLSSETGSVQAVVDYNRALLSAIAAYFSLPGYKRFFKGMEVPRYEIAE